MQALDTPLTHKRERRKEARPGELLEAALDLFVEKGFAATRVEEVAARAGVSKGTLFLYFPSKEELFMAVVRENIVRAQTEGAEELARFAGNSAELLEMLMLEWGRRYGATKAAGISKLVMSGEFRALDMGLTIHSVLAPLLFLVTWKHSMAPCCPAEPIDPETFIRHHADLLVRGLSV